MSNFLGYSSTSKVYRVLNRKTLIVEKSIHITFYESSSKCVSKVNENEVVELMEYLQIKKAPKLKEEGNQLIQPQEPQWESTFPRVKDKVKKEKIFGNLSQI